MKYSEITELNQLTAQSGVNRLPGIHLTDVIDDLLLESGLVEPYNEQSEQERQANFGKGFAWEMQKEEQLRVQFGKSAPFRPPQIRVDGILTSPDGYWNWEGVDCIVEYKATLSSMNKPIEDRIRWKYQIASYCKVMNVCHCILFVLFYCGDWKPPKTTDRAYLLEFTQCEIDEIWYMIVQHAKRKGMVE